MRKLFERIVDFMEENGSIQSEYRDVYLFALQTIAVYASILERVLSLARPLGNCYIA